MYTKGYATRTQISIGDVSIDSFLTCSYFCAFVSIGYSNGGHSPLLKITVFWKILAMILGPNLTASVGYTPRPLKFYKLSAIL